MLYQSFIILTPDSLHRQRYKTWLNQRQAGLQSDGCGRAGLCIALFGWWRTRMVRLQAARGLFVIPNLCLMGRVSSLQVITVAHFITGRILSVAKRNFGAAGRQRLPAFLLFLHRQLFFFFCGKSRSLPHRNQVESLTQRQLQRFSLFLSNHVCLFV